METNKHHAAARRKTHKKVAAAVAIDKMESVIISLEKQKVEFQAFSDEKEKLVFGEQPGGLVDSFLREMSFLQKKKQKKTNKQFDYFSQFHHWLDGQIVRTKDREKEGMTKEEYKRDIVDPSCYCVSFRG